MSITLSYRQELNYLLVEANGQWTTESVREAIEAVHSEATRRGEMRLLLDGREISKPPDEMTRFYSADRWAMAFKFPFRVAFVTRPEIYNGFGVTVAVNRGATVEVFFEKERALEWLLAAQS
jgi:hypothetical protein